MISSCPISSIAFCGRGGNDQDCFAFVRRDHDALLCVVFQCDSKRQAVDAVQSLAAAFGATLKHGSAPGSNRGSPKGSPKGSPARSRSPRTSIDRSPSLDSPRSIHRRTNSLPSSPMMDGKPPGFALSPGLAQAPPADLSASASASMLSNMTTAVTPKNERVKRRPGPMPHRLLIEDHDANGTDGDEVFVIDGDTPTAVAPPTSTPQPNRVSVVPLAHRDFLEPDPTLHGVARAAHLARSLVFSPVHKQCIGVLNPETALDARARIHPLPSGLDAGNTLPPIRVDG